MIKTFRFFFPGKVSRIITEWTRGISRKGEVGVVTEILGPTVLHLLHYQEFRF